MQYKYNNDHVLKKIILFPFDFSITPTIYFVKNPYISYTGLHDKVYTCMLVKKKIHLQILYQLTKYLIGIKLTHEEMQLNK